VIVINESLIAKDANREDCTVIRIPAREMAQEAGTDRAANFVMLGTYLGATGVVPAEIVEKEIENEFTGRKAKFAPANIAAFRAGVAEGQKVQVTA